MGPSKHQTTKYNVREDTMINVGISPLRAAREWRGISLVLAAQTCGLPVGQAEALEDGRAEVFATVDEMVAAAVLYSASMGIGRDEAMALLDRTIAGGGQTTSGISGLSDAVFDEPQSTLPNPQEFSRAVHERSVAMDIQRPSVADAGPAAPAFDMPVPPTYELAAPTYELAAPTYDLVPPTFTPPTFDVEVPPTFDISRLAQDAEETGEMPVIDDSLTAWAAQVPMRPRRAPGRFDDLQQQLAARIERVVGRERLDRTGATMRSGWETCRAGIADVRGSLNRSEHAPLIVAVVLGVVAIAVMVAVASVFTGGDGTKPAKQVSATPKPAATAPAPDAAQKAAAAVLPLLQPSQIRLEVLNAGSRTGVARDMAAKLKSLGYDVQEVGNSNTNYATAVILHEPKYRREAVRLSKQTGITTFDTLPAAPASSGKPTIIIALV